MLKKALQLVLAVYRVTALFPEGEVLIGQMRQTANQVLAELVFKHQRKSVKEIKLLLRYFQIAQAQNWTKPINFAILTREYQKLSEEIKQKRFFKKSSPLAKEKRKIRINDRQKKILEYVQNLPEFQAGDLLKRFSGLSRRTLNRELEELCVLGFLKKIGSGRGIFYKKIICQNLPRTCQKKWQNNGKIVAK